MQTVKLRITYFDGRFEERSLPMGSYQLGRDSGDIVLSDPNVSARHAQLEIRPGSVSISDLGSTNGLADAAGTRLPSPHHLRLHEPVRLGGSALTLLEAAMVAGGTQAMPQMSAPTPMPVAPMPVAAAFQGRKTRGTVIRVPDQSPGILFVEGAQRAFALVDVWRSPIAPEVNQCVEIELDASGSITALHVVSTQELAQERLHDLGGAAQVHGKQAAALATQGLSALAARMSKTGLAAAVVLWVAWFLLPALSVSFIVKKSATFWELLSYDPGDWASFGSGSHGPFGLLGLLAIAAPFAAPFWRRTRARLLYLAPLAYLLLTVLKLAWQVDGALSEAGSLATSTGFGAVASELQQSAVAAVLGMISVEYGSYVLIASALVLAVHAFKGVPAVRAIAAPNRGVPRSVKLGIGAVVALALIAGGALALGVGGDLGQGELTEKIDGKLASEKPRCWSLQNMNVVFPVTVKALASGTAADPIIKGLVRGGYVTVRASDQPAFWGRAEVIDLTSKGRAAGVWDPANGFCLGRRRVDAVVRWTEPVAGRTEVTYTWKLGDRPSWADPRLFEEVEGMLAPVEGRARAQKTSDGWQVL